MAFRGTFVGVVARLGSLFFSFFFFPVKGLWAGSEVLAAYLDCSGAFRCRGGTLKVSATTTATGQCGGVGRGRVSAGRASDLGNTLGMVGLPGLGVWSETHSHFLDFCNSLHKQSWNP